MNTLNIKTIAIALTLAFSAGAMAQGMSKADYQAGKDRISADYKSARGACTSFSGNAKDICVADAEGKKNVAKAELEVSYKPSAKTKYDARVARAEADYAVAKEKCDDLAGNPKDVCVKEAKAAQVAAKADAKAWMKTAEANSTASEKGADARKDARADKADADYAVAKEKCDSLAGGAKDQCLNDAKARFGKS